MGFGKEDLSQYNSAKSPWYQVSLNGKVDIGIEQGHDQKVGLTTGGMFKMVNEWLDSHADLDREQKDKLIEKLRK